VVWCGVVWCGVVWCGVVWCGVVWCGVVVVWCGVVWCGALLHARWLMKKHAKPGISAAVLRTVMRSARSGTEI
jgi:hypothetical protein